MNIPAGFSVPKNYEFYITDSLLKVTFSPLNTTISKEDFNTIINNRTHLKGLFGKLDDWWPSDHLTEKDNYQTLLWHEEEFVKRGSFAYAIHLNQKYIGCLYIYGLKEVVEIVTKKDESLLYVFMWTTKENYKNGIDKLIFQQLKKWVEEKWCFAVADYPGRTSPLTSSVYNTASWIKTLDTLKSDC